MTRELLSHFNHLKVQVAERFRASHSSSSKDYRNWKGQDILDFQEDLAKQVNGRISERWFYTHFKSETTKLPRIDMLNLLSQYAGYQNWAEFLRASGVTEDQLVRALPNPDAAKKMMASILVLAVVSLIGIASFQLMTGNQHYEFCFIDADRKQPITNTPIEVSMLRPGESPILFNCDSLGCLELEAFGDRIQFVVQAPYYRTDTITRTSFNQNQGETVQLHTDDYAMMIHVFSSAKVNDWKKRRAQLNKMFAADAEIYQIDHRTLHPVELFNKSEFIDKLTMPVSSLSKIQVLETVHTGEQIVQLRFTQPTSRDD